MPKNTRVIVGLGVIGVLVVWHALGVFNTALDEADRSAAASHAEFRVRREKQCTDLGGVAIFSGWTGDLARCDFPPSTRPR